jgi:hypothetical protein
MLAEAEQVLVGWAEVAEKAFREGRDIAAALEAAFWYEPDVSDEKRDRLETLNGVHSNAAGFQRWLSKGGHVHPHPHSSVAPSEGAGTHGPETEHEGHGITHVHGDRNPHTH